MKNKTLMLEVPVSCREEGGNIILSFNFNNPSLMLLSDKEALILARQKVDFSPSASKQKVTA